MCDRPPGLTPDKSIVARALLRAASALVPMLGLPFCGPQQSNLAAAQGPDHSAAALARELFKERCILAELKAIDPRSLRGYRDAASYAAYLLRTQRHSGSHR